MTPILLALLLQAAPAVADDDVPDDAAQDTADGDTLDDLADEAARALAPLADAWQRARTRCGPDPGIVTPIALGATPSRDWNDACLQVLLDVAGRGTVGFPAVGLSRRLELARGRLELGLLGPGPLSARIAFIATRSAPPNGYLGIDGEAIVPRLRIAEARADWAKAGLTVAAGVVDDLWLMSLQSRWGLRYIAPMVDQQTGLAFRADVGAWAGWSAPRGIASLAVSVTGGEGDTLRDRNNGVNTAGLLVVKPLAWRDDARRDGVLSVGVYGRDGSRGIDRARDYRVGGFAIWQHRWIGVGASTIHGWGLDGDASQTPSALSAWVRTGTDLPAIGWARIDRFCAERGVPESATLSWRVGGGPLLPWRANPERFAPLYVAVGYEGERRGALAAPVAGAPAVVHELWLQLGARFGVTVPVTPVGSGAAP